MDTLQSASRLAQMQAMLAPQIEIAQAWYRSIPPSTISYLQSLSTSPVYKAMSTFPTFQTANSLQSLIAQQQNISLVKKFLSTFETLTLNEKESIIKIASSIDIPNHLFKQSGDADRPLEKHDIHADISFTVYALPVDIDSSWVQIRKVIYPLVHDRLAPMVGLCALLYNAANLHENPTLSYLFVLLAIVVFVVDAAGPPEKPPK